MDVPSVLVTNRADHLPFARTFPVLQQMILPQESVLWMLCLKQDMTKIGIIGGDTGKIVHQPPEIFIGCKESFAEHGKEMDA